MSTSFKENNPHLEVLRGDNYDWSEVMTLQLDYNQQGKMKKPLKSLLLVKMSRSVIRLQESKIWTILWSFWEKGQYIMICTSVIALQILWK